MLSAVICYLDIAEKNCLIPVVDFLNYPTVYNDNDVSEEKNSWEYYFYQPALIDLNEVYRSRNVFVTSCKYAQGYDYSMTNIPGALNLYDKYIRFKPNVIGPDPLLRDYEKVLGVHYRGQDMRIARGHWFPPSRDQILAAIDLMIDRDGYERLFVVTEDQRLLDELIGVYGTLVLHSNSFRTDGWNAYSRKSRYRHFYELGREVISDAFWLSKCGGLIHCSSNVAEFAIFHNRDQYKSRIFINNGPNSKWFPIYKYLWRIKNSLPKSLGGFSTGGDALFYTSKKAN